MRLSLFHAAMLAWVVPVAAVALALGAAGLRARLPQGVALERCHELAEDEAPAPGEVFIGSTLACPPEALEPAFTMRLLLACTSETAQVVGAGAGWLTAVVLASVVLSKTRGLQAERRARRVALAALVVLIVVPVCGGALMTVALALAPMRG